MDAGYPLVLGTQRSTANRWQCAETEASFASFSLDTYPAAAGESNADPVRTKWFDIGAQLAQREVFYIKSTHYRAEFIHVLSGRAM